MVGVRCPHCGGGLEIVPVGRDDIRGMLSERLGTGRDMLDYPFERTGPVAGAQPAQVRPRQRREVMRESPARRASREADVTVPFLQAVLSAAMAAVVSASVLTGLSVWLSWRWWIVPVGSLSLGFLVMAWRWEDLLADSRSLLRRVETIINEDLDGDGRVGEPERPEFVESVHMEVEHKGDRRGGAFADLPVSRSLFVVWASSVTGGGSLAVSRWAGKSAPFSRSEYDQMMEFLMRAGIVAWVNAKEPKHGRELTRPGKAALRAWLDGKV